MSTDLFGFLCGIGLVQGAVLAGVLLFARSGHRLANVIMAALVVAITLSLLQKWMILQGLWVEYPLFAFVTYPLRYAWGPLLYLYAYSLTGGQLNLRQWWHFLPAILFFLAVNLTHWQLDSVQQRELVSYVWSLRDDPSQEAVIRGFLHAYWRPVLDFQAHSMVFTLHLTCYCILVLGQIRDHNRRLQRHFSSLEHMNLRWLRALTIACLVFLGLFLVFNRVPFLMTEYFDRNTPVANVHSILLVVLLYGIAISALFQPSLISGVTQALDSEPVWEKEREHRPTEPDANSSIVSDHPVTGRAEDNEKYQRSRLDAKDAQRYKIKLMDAMQDRELYLNSDLTLPDLAKAAGLTAPQVSQVLNGQMNQNFFSFVNNYRIQLARNMLLDPETSDMPIVELAVEVGFKSKSTFYDAFKRATNMTPTQFKLAMHESSASEKDTV